MKKDRVLIVFISWAVVLWSGAAFLNQANAEERVPEWRIVMTYAGGYSPIKEVRIEILKTADAASYTSRKIYYDNTPPEEKREEISPAKFESLAAQLQQNDVWTLPNLSEYVATDGFTYRIEIENAGKKHAFEVYFPELQKDKRYVNIVSAIHNAAGSL